MGILAGAARKGGTLGKPEKGSRIAFSNKESIRKWTPVELLDSEEASEEASEDKFAEASQSEHPKCGILVEVDICEC